MDCLSTLPKLTIITVIHKQRVQYLVASLAYYLTYLKTDSDSHNTGIKTVLRTAKVEKSSLQFRLDIEGLIYYNTSCQMIFTPK